MTSTSAVKHPRTIFFSVGEPSGDLHGANLIRDFQVSEPDINVIGFGGPRMQQAGMELLSDLTQLAVMWIVDAVANLGTFWRLLQVADEYFQRHRPDAVVLIDYPGFNWWIARKARKHGIPVFYYGAPQMWAWGSWRIRKLRRLVTHVICKLPFEAEWYQSRGCDAVYVGHPYFDELQSKPVDREFMHRLGSRQLGRLVALLPGSRTREVQSNLPAFIKAAGHVHRRAPGTRFAVAAYNDAQGKLARQILQGCELPIEVYVDRTSELIQVAHCCMACSGSVSLELMYFTTPAVIHYRLNRRMYFFVKHFMMQVRYMTLVNLLACDDRYNVRQGSFDPTEAGAERIPFPEYPTCTDRSIALAEHTLTWLADPVAHQHKIDQLVELRARFGSAGATRTAARFILDQQPKVPYRSVA